VLCWLLQVKLTAEPKKQALELLRRKIEAQDIKVQAVRRRYQAAKQVRCPGIRIYAAWFCVASH
jgi:hypothetical protein